jgi:DNA-binding response OmpR family regulator
VRYPLNVLVVDDEPDVVFLLAWHLQRAGYDVVTAGNGWEALDRLRAERPDLILLDLMLPDLDGFGVCEIIRRDTATATIPIIILSAWHTQESQQLARDFGVLEYVTKPFQPDDLLRRIHHLTGGATAGRRSEAPVARFAQP